MIKCNVKVCGLTKGQPVVRTAKEGGGKFIAFTLGVSIPAKSGINKMIDVSVTVDGTEADLGKYAEGLRLQVEGTLTMRKREDNIYFNLRANSITATDAQDSVEGTVEFRGTVGKSVDERKDKKGHDYYNFSAFTTEKVGETYNFIWLRFVRFGAKREDWLHPGVGVDAKGDFEISVYKERLNLGCRLTELAQWDKSQYQNSQPAEPDPTSDQPF